MRPQFTWRLRSRALRLGERTLIMGVVNVTPDSFSDGGRFLESGKAVAHALSLLEEGADILDVGGESTRPGSKIDERGVSEEEELRRVLPVIAGIRKQAADALISVDTYKSAVARAAVAAGAEIVNDVSAGRWDPHMPAVLAELKCGVVLMHMRGRPPDWRALPRLNGDSLLSLVRRELDECAQTVMRSGIRRETIVLDPGFGFGKNFEENYPLLARMNELHDLGFPLLAGTSRKSFIGRALAKNGKDALVNQRQYGTVAAVTASILQGAEIVRVHDVKPAWDAARVADVILDARG